MDNTASAADSIAANTIKHGMPAPMEDLKISTLLDVDPIRSLSIEESQPCVLHPAESETFQRSVAAQSEALGQIAAIWMDLISQSVPLAECVAEIVQRTSLSAAQVRRHIHSIRALSVEVFEDHRDTTPADI
ncbi:hypothetical protein [Kocuria arenosa]|uniref:hypothetical protein n=1 Tax=Kocuria arenosa TaxID=3071446 RepID=UPI0034D527EB